MTAEATETNAFKRGRKQRTHIIMVIIIDMSGCLTSALRPPKAESSYPYDTQVHREIVPAVGVFTQYLYKHLCVYVSIY